MGITIEVEKFGNSVRKGPVELVFELCVEDTLLVEVVVDSFSPQEVSKEKVINKVVKDKKMLAPFVMHFTPVNPWQFGIGYRSATIDYTIPQTR